MSMTEAQKVKARKRLPSADPWKPTSVARQEVHAIKALFAGKATEHQQIMATALIYRMTGVEDLETRPDERASVFAGGKRFIGTQILMMVRMSPEFIETLDDL